LENNTKLIKKQRFKGFLITKGNGSYRANLLFLELD